MAGKKHGFMYKMRHDLAYRLMTAVFVFILPVCIIGCILLGIVWDRTKRELQNIEQSRLEDAMAYWERDCAAVDNAMEYFVSMFLDELNYNNSEVGATVPYSMFSQLERVLSSADHNGLVALRDNHTGRILAQMQDPVADAALMDSQVQQFTAQLADDHMIDASWQEINGHHYLLKRFDYRNYSVFIALNIEDSLRARSAFIQDENTRIYVTDGSRVLELTDDGLVPTVLVWEKCVNAGFGRTSIEWQSETVPIAVCIVEEQGIVERVPAGTWVLLILFVVAILNAGRIWRIIRLEVLEPARKLSGAMHQIQIGNLEYRLEDTHYRNSDDMQYLFDTFDEMADEIEASQEKDKKMYQAEMDNLRLQVNPHMLLNSLNTIYSLAQMKKFEVIQEYALHLVDYFRYALRRNDNLVSLKEELEVVQTYIDIQKIRYPGSISFVYTINREEYGRAMVPPLLIQNFVENAVKYAVMPGKVTEILLDVRHLNDRLEISVTDTGNGMKGEILEQLQAGDPYVDALGHKHIGIWNCRRRIEVFYNEEPRIKIISGSDGTQILLDIPFILEDGK